MNVIGNMHCKNWEGFGTLSWQDNDAFPFIYSRG